MEGNILLVGWLVGLLVSWFVGWLVCWMVGHSVSKLEKVKKKVPELKTVLKIPN